MYFWDSNEVRIVSDEKLQLYEAKIATSSAKVCGSDSFGLYFYKGL